MEECRFFICKSFLVPTYFVKVFNTPADPTCPMHCIKSHCATACQAATQSSHQLGWEPNSSKVPYYTPVLYTPICTERNILYMRVRAQVRTHTKTWTFNMQFTVVLRYYPPLRVTNQSTPTSKIGGSLFSSPPWILWKEHK